MKENDKTAREELLDLVKDLVLSFIEWIKPNPNDNLFLKIVKSILKIPIALFMLLVSPFIFILLGIIFVILL